MVRLRRVQRKDLTLTRHRKGKGFCFRDAEGAPITDPQLRTRLMALGIPPAWKNVRIAAHERAHIQAIGQDEGGRDQYIYHPEWTVRRDFHKQQRLVLLTSALPRIRRRIRRDLGAETGSRALALALGAAIIDQTAMRIGREKYLLTSGTRGAGTLYSRDVRVEGADICISFSAKGGKDVEYCFTDARIADAVARLKSLRGQRLLKYRDDSGKIRPISAAAINDYLSEAAGGEISAKDFRTLHASALAAEALAAQEAAASATARKRQVTKVVTQVADVLRNTPTICRKSYIAPCLFQLFDEGRLTLLWSQAKKGARDIRARESRLAAILAAT